MEREDTMGTQADLETCRDLGRKAQEARAQHDESRAKFHTDYMRQFVNARPEDQRTELRAAFDAGYKAEYEAKSEWRRLNTRM
jgi:hypothetical protein